MGRTHEALERAEKEYERNFKVRVDPPPLPSIPKETAQKAPKPPRIVIPPNGSEVYESLKVNLMARYPDRSIRSIVFCSTTHGDGATTTATNFAAVLAKDGDQKVLLVDVNLRTPGLHDRYQIDISPGLSDYILSTDNPTCHTFAFKQQNFCILPTGSTNSSPIGLFDSIRFDQFLQEMKEKFDYVILDAPPVPSFSESRVICPKVDGVVLVVGSGKTRRQVALKAKKVLEEAGAKILGIVINRRKYHVPEWVYRRL